MCFKIPVVLIESITDNQFVKEYHAYLLERQEDEERIDENFAAEEEVKLADVFRSIEQDFNKTTKPHEAAPFYSKRFTDYAREDSYTYDCTGYYSFMWNRWVCVSEY